LSGLTERQHPSVGAGVLVGGTIKHPQFVLKVDASDSGVRAVLSQGLTLWENFTHVPFSPDDYLLLNKTMMWVTMNS